MFELATACVVKTRRAQVSPSTVFFFLIKMSERPAIDLYGYLLLLRQDHFSASTVWGKIVSSTPSSLTHSLTDLPGELTDSLTDSVTDSLNHSDPQAVPHQFEATSQCPVESIGNYFFWMGSGK